MANRQNDIDGATVNVLEELVNYGFEYQLTGRDHDNVKVLCPFHDDTTPSCNVSVSKAVFRCPACDASGKLPKLIARKTGRPVGEILAELALRYPALAGDRVISPAIIEQYFAHIWDAGPLLYQLYQRGVTNEIIEQRRIGYDKKTGRITIPIHNQFGAYVGLKFYLPGAKKEKFRNLKGYAQPRLYPIEQLQYDSIVICAGELKALVAADVLNPCGVGAIASTGGEGIKTWLPEFTDKFTNKQVWVCADIDPTGRKYANELCRLLLRVAEWVGDAVLPLDHDTYPKGDINDFLTLDRSGGEQDRVAALLDVLNSTPQFTLRGEADTSAPPVDVTIVEAVSAANAGKRIRINGIMSAVATTPYPIPKTVEVTCDKSQEFCGICPVYFNKEIPSIVTIPAESPAILEMVEVPNNRKSDALKIGCGIPQRCQVCSFETKSYYHVEDTRVSPQLSITTRSTERVMQPAFCILPDDNSTVIANETYNLTGRMLPHPQTQQATLLFSQVEQAENVLSSYKPAPEDLQRLAVFRPNNDNWTLEGLSERLNAVYEDLEANVTRIFQRRRMHLVMDLAWHSALFLDFDGATGYKGWVEVLVMGDSSQGKSETSDRLMAHYRLGERVECKSASAAGIIGGLQTLGGRWFVSWGALPTHDKRLVVLEEFGGLSHESIGKLTDMRSRGIAEIAKIERQRTHARTRLIALSNLRGEGVKLSSYNFGVEAVRDLVGAPQDVRRFDLVHIVSENDIDPAIINRLQTDRPQVPHTYTSELCRELILWAWTRDKVIIPEDTTRLILQRATELCEVFSGDIPILDRGSARFKIARLATALAARTFSTSQDMSAIVVRPCHVEYIAAMLRHEYERPVVGYADYSKAIQAKQALTDEATRELTINVTQITDAKDVVDSMLRADKLDLQDLQDWCGFDRIDAQRLLSLFVRKHAVVRDGKVYRKTAAFIELLKQLQDNGQLRNGENRPLNMPPHGGNPSSQEF